MRYKVAIKLGDSYGKERRGYLASSRIRGHNLSKYWRECDDFFYPEEFNQTSEEFFDPRNQFKILKDYDVVIFNKTYEWRVAKMLNENGQIVIVDMCDPDHLLTHSSQQRVNDCISTLEYATAVVVNGQEMKDSVNEVYKGEIHIIPDRMDLEGLPQKTNHSENLEKVVWYGYSENLRVLEPYLKDIIDMGLEITVISDKFFDNLLIAGCKHKPQDKITFKVWHPDTINEQILSHDAVFIGDDLDPYFSKFKSNNRAMTGYSLGMPVAWDIDDLNRLKSKSTRELDAKEGSLMCRRYFDCRHSVWEMDQLIKKLLRDKSTKSMIMQGEKNANINGL